MTLDSLPDTARLWIYAAPRPLTASEQADILKRLDGFFATWTSHQRPVQGAARIEAHQFLLIAASLQEGEISGCGIDKSVHAVEALGAEMGVQWASPLMVAYRAADGSVQLVSRGAFRKLVRAGKVDAQTPVFDLSLTELAAFRDGRFEQAAGLAWHSRVFRIPALST